MSLRDSQTEDLMSLGRHGFRSGPARQTLIPTPHNSLVCLLETCTYQKTRASEASERRRRPERAPTNRKKMANRGRDEANNAGAVSEGANVFSVAESHVLETRGGDRSHRHRISRTCDSETGFTSCACTIRGLRSGPATPHPERAHGHETSPLRGRKSPVRCLDRRPQARGAPTPTARPRWPGRTAPSRWSCEWQVEKILFSGRAILFSGLVTPSNGFTSM